MEARASTATNVPQMGPRAPPDDQTGRHELAEWTGRVGCPGEGRCRSLSHQDLP